MCMEAYLQGQDLWELVTGADAGIPTDIPEHAESRRKLKIKCGKTLFALRTSISKEFIDHVRDVSSPKEVWDTLEKLCTKKNTTKALAKQMAKNFESNTVLFSKGKPNKKNTSAWNKTKEEDSSAEKGGNSQSKKSITCFRCGKTGHIKRNCRVKISKANVACASEGDDQLKWEQCFTVEEVVAT
ncbi:hypothetical protein Pint_11997 [Pistacia integerrima]|uniref:Uncharacterized protein n=1 Tax=Pistacia integerrima TaxID=434235 RepID=A0ACC0XLW2_9ROSI|nr:hypothetical protein Pint_11997 [Pistacia integerrima]